MSRQAQAGLRRTMEKSAQTCRLIMCCSNPSKLIDPIKSRCLGIRVPAPSEDEIAGVLREVAEKERLTLPDELAARVAKASGRNLRRAILSLEECRVAQYPFDPKMPIPAPDWELLAAARCSRPFPRRPLDPFTDDRRREPARYVDRPWTGRGDAAAATWIFRGGATELEETWTVRGRPARTSGTCANRACASSCSVRCAPRDEPSARRARRRSSIVCSRVLAPAAAGRRGAARGAACFCPTRCLQSC